jgi:hypothetical protein
MLSAPARVVPECFDKALAILLTLGALAAECRQPAKLDAARSQGFG